MANPSTPTIRQAMVDGVLACIETPAQGRNQVPAGAKWCADNGRGPGKDGKPGKGWRGEDYWWDWLVAHPGKDDCLFAVAPDVVGDAQATLDWSATWLPRIRELGIPAALAAQDGLEHLDVPWDSFDVLFIGGSTEWKMSRAAIELAEQARRHGKQVHAGRVNSGKRFSYASAPYPFGLGADTADGTYLAHGPDVNLPKLLRWIDVHESQHTLYDLLTPKEPA